MWALGIDIYLRDLAHVEAHIIMCPDRCESTCIHGLHDTACIILVGNEALVFLATLYTVAQWLEHVVHSISACMRLVFFSL